MIAFIAATPLQIFNCISIAYDRKEKIDLYIMRFAVKNMHDYLNVAAKCEYINRIINCPDFYGVKGKKSIIKDFVFTSRDFIEKEPYTDLYTTYIGDRASIFYDEMVKYNPNIDVHFYEEGIGVYLNDSILFAESPRRKKLNKLLRIESVNKHINSLDIYQKELVRKDMQTPLKPIQIIKGEKREYLRKFFSFDDNIYRQYKYIFFDQYFYYDEKDERYPLFKDYNKTLMVNSVFNNIKKENVLIKMHPVHHSKEYEGCDMKVDYAEGTIWESVILDFGEEMNSKTFVTIFSTAVFSPKIMFDLEPTIVIIGKALQNEYKKSQNESISKWSDFFWNANIEKFVDEVKRIYKKPSKIIVPSSLEEIQTVLIDD